MKKLVPMLCVAILLMASYAAFAQSNDVLNSDAGKAATEGYNYQQQTATAAADEKIPRPSWFL